MKESRVNVNYVDDAIHQFEAANVAVADIRGFLDDLRRVSSNVDNKTGSAANKSRATVFNDGLEAFVRARVRENQSLTPEELVKEVRHQHWNKKNKRGEPYADSYLLSKIRPLLKRARKDARMANRRSRIRLHHFLEKPSQASYKQIGSIRHYRTLTA